MLGRGKGHSTKVFVSLLALCLCLSFSFSPFANAKTTDKKIVPTQSEKSQKYSGEELFRGLVFGQGDVAKLFPEMWGKSQLELTNSKESLKAVDLVISQINKNSPNFFNHFKTVIESGNPYLIDQEGQEVKKVIKEAFKDINGKYPELKYPEIGTDCVIVTFVYAYAGVVHTAGAAINVAAAVDVWLWAGFWMYPKNTKNTSSDLAKEEFISEISERLASN
ncbi:sporulation delaying protein family toxin [Tuberibacillus calidus]|jgi:SdpC family antimicrobial peptide|uniref:sporulation delaying protein family toxin n=1 Tax=Tuberibacillus calidus TaxID=340097 RepID=UPI000416F4E8|nr:sporulation delaying protein family toxin [Tuberibacillus calidus]